MKLMDIRPLTQDDLTQIKDVWKTCFNDSDIFLSTYFESVANAENGIGIFDGKKLVSDLFAVTMNAQIAGMVYQSEFLSGCATLPEARNQHLMRDLIKTALLDMRSRNVCVTFLHPFLHSFYRKFGYETVNYVLQYVAQPASAPEGLNVQIVDSLSDLPEEALYASYVEYISQYGNYFMRSKERMHGWLKLLFDDGGKAVFTNDGKNTPYALFYEGSDDDGKPLNKIFELVYFDETQLQALTSGTGAPGGYFLSCDPTARNAEEYTMMRIVCPEIMLQSYSYTPGQKPFVINIHDSFLGQDYNLRVVPGTQGATTEEVQAASDIVVGIDDLARIFTGTFSAARFPEAAEIFRKNSSCYFDTY